MFIFIPLGLSVLQKIEFSGLDSDGTLQDTRYKIQESLFRVGYIYKHKNIS